MSNLIDNLGNELSECKQIFQPHLFNSDKKYLLKIFEFSTKLIKDLNKLVEKYNNLRNRMINEGIEYEIKTRRDYEYVGLSPKIYTQDLVKYEREQTEIVFKGVVKELLELCDLPTEIVVIREMERTYKGKKITEKEGDKEFITIDELDISDEFNSENYITIVIEGYEEREYLNLSLLLIPNINYFKQIEVLREPSLPYNIIMLTSAESLINAVDDIFTYKLIHEVFDKHCDFPIATALFFTSHIMGDRPLKKLLPELGYNEEEIKNILRAKHDFHMEYDTSYSLTKNIFNIIASFGMVDWDLYNLINYVADQNLGGDEFSNKAVKRIQKFMKEVRSKIRIFMDNIRMDNVRVKVRDTIVGSGEKYGVSRIGDVLYKNSLSPITSYDDAGIVVSITEQLNPPVYVNDKFANIKDPLKIISPKPLLCDEPEYDKNGYPVYDVLLKDGTLLRNVSEPDLAELRYQILSAEMRCKKRQENALYNVRKITSEYTTYQIKNIKRQVKNKIDLSYLNEVATEGVSMNTKIDFIKCMTEHNISSELQINIIIYSDMIMKTDTLPPHE